MKQIKELEKAITKFTDYFIKRYFGKDVDMFWVGDLIGGVLFVSDYFFDLNKMIDYVKYNYSFDEMSEYYYYSTDCKPGKVIVNIKNWKQLIK